jgi:hypothetical protein
MSLRPGWGYQNNQTTKLCPIFLRRGWRHQNDQTTILCPIFLRPEWVYQKTHTQTCLKFLRPGWGYQTYDCFFKDWLVVGTPPQHRKKKKKKKKRKKRPTEQKRSFFWNYSMDKYTSVISSPLCPHQITGGYQRAISALKNPEEIIFSVGHMWVCKKI